MFVNPFSDTLGGQCTDSKIKGNKYNRNTRKDCGACAPYRRLHLCHHNLESIDTDKIDNTHKLLLEVCMAAKYEGNSIKTYYTEHEYTNPDTKSQLCTVLERSFADIGDIVRGRDLFHGNPQEKEKRDELESKLKKIFGKIYEGLKTTKGAQNYYKDDPKKNYYKLREDWWTVNRDQVWKALTCDVKGNKYFRGTCSTGTATYEKCRCNDDQVPTYFDYVPQYLRWFEEWAEDFCRLRKHKLEDAIKKCRGDKNEKYCDLNRHDCVKTIRGDHDFVEEDDCIGCHFSCAGFVKWIDNQKLEFLKQKNKYADEMQKYTNGETRGGGGSGKKRVAGKSNYDRYESKFYDKLKKNNYKNVEDFLKKLNNEAICQKRPEASGETADAADFTKIKTNETFSHTTYCKACPWCGAHKGKGGNGKWIAKDD
ncbi:hypothetical protein PFFCH_05513, partial [Plasmodium falciparum FCH/4]